MTSRLKKAAWKQALAEHGVNSAKFLKLTEFSRFVRRQLPECRRLGTADGIAATFLAMNGAPLEKVASRARAIERDLLKKQPIWR